jgi:hypothetical protein
MITFIEDVSILSALSNDELVEYSVKLVKHENRTGLEIIACLREAEKRLLACVLGKSSLFAYATEVLKMSNGNAQMKIDTMRLMKESPTAREKVQSGELTVVNAAKVKSFFRREDRTGNTYSPEKRDEVVQSVCGLSQAKCETVLLALNPQAVPEEKVRRLTETKTEIKMVVNQETMENLKRLKELLSNQMPNANYADLLDFLAREKVDKLEKKQMGITLKKLERCSTTSTTPDEVVAGHKATTPIEVTANANCKSTTPVEVAAPDKTTSIGEAQVEVKSASPIEVKVKPAPASQARVLPTPTPRIYIPVEDRRWAMRKARGQCENVGQSGVRCTSRRHLHVDHQIPLALGGLNERSNYRVLCRPCNLYYAKMYLGETMNQYVPSMR